MKSTVWVSEGNMNEKVYFYWHVGFYIFEALLTHLSRYLRID